MKNKRQKVITIISLIIIAVGGYLGLQYLHKNSPIFNFFFTPKDLYSPVVCSNFDLSKNNNYQLSFTNKYPGGHNLEILVEKPTKILDKYVTEFKIRVIISAEDKKIVNTVVTEKNISSFWGGENNSGFAIYRYRVPSDLPQGKLLKATIQIEMSDEDFYEKYGKQKLCFTKHSDE